MSREDRTIEDRVAGVEHYVHGRGWWARFSAWIGVVIMAAVGFYAMNRQADQTIRDRQASCRATAIALEGVQANAEAGIRPEAGLAPIPTDGEPELIALLASDRENTLRENVRRSEVLVEVADRELAFLRSTYCDGVNSSITKTDLERPENR